MTEYISREATENEISRLSNKPNDWIGKGNAIDAVNAIPAADVVEVRHGRWVEQSPDFDLCGVAYYKCSECGKEQQLNSHYCQFCGAKMDEEGEK